MKFSKLFLRSSLLFIPLTLLACGGGSKKNDMETEDPSVQLRYAVTLGNITHNQPLSPPAVLLHADTYTAWEVGMPASAGLEMLAESGSPMDFISEANSALAQVAGGDILMPGNSATLMLNAEMTETEFMSALLQFSIAAMPVNTNDAFSGVTGWDLSHLEIGESASALLPIYDAGTERNTETAATVPGPAAGGEGFNSTRDDIADQVTRHPGVVTMDDGYAESALNQSHRFEQSAMAVTITRLAP